MPSAALRHFLVAEAGAIPLGIGIDVQLFNIPAVGVDLDGRQHAAAFVVVAVGELVAGGHRLHADLAEEVLVVVGPAAAHEEHRRLALAAAADVAADFLDFHHLRGNHTFDLGEQVRIFEVLGDLAERLGRLSAPMKFTLNHGTPNRFWIMSAT